MTRLPSPSLAVLGIVAVGAVATIAVATADLPLYTVLVVFWLDLTVSLGRRAGQLFVASPRTSVSPTGAADIPQGGHSTLSTYEQAPCRFLTPKRGSVTVSEHLPPVTIYNLRPALLVAGGLVSVVKHNTGSPLECAERFRRGVRVSR